MRRNVEQAEAVAGHRICAAGDAERVAPCGEPQQRIRAADFGRIAARETAADRRAVRRGQRPADRVVVGQAVEIELALVCEGEAVAVDFACAVEAAVDGLAERQRDRRGVDHFLQVEAVVELRESVIRLVLRRPDAAFDQQRVAAADCQRARRHVLVEIDRPEHLSTARIEQTPADPVAVGRLEALTVEVDAVTGGHRETVGVRFVGGIEAPGRCCTERDRRRRSQVEQPECVSAGGAAVGANQQLVGPRQHHVDRRAAAAEFVRLGGVGAAAVDFEPARTDQRPAKPAVVVRRKAVEVEPGRRRQVEDVAVDLAGRAQAAVDPAAERHRGASQRHGRRVALQRQCEVVSDGRSFERAAFEQQRVAAAQQQVERPTVLVEIVRPEDLPAGRIEQSPVGIAAAARTPVESDLVAGGRVEAKGLRRAAGGKAAAHAGAVGDLLRRGEVEQPESEVAGRCGRCVDGQRVIARRQVEHNRIAALA